MSTDSKNSHTEDDFFGSLEDNNDFFENVDNNINVEENKPYENIVPIPEKKNITVNQKKQESTPQNKKHSDIPVKRSSKDFSLDMDAILITAQSAMIVEAMKYYTKNNFSSRTLPHYQEAIRGIEVYIKILNRNPDNYNKLKGVICSDQDCANVEKIAFNLFYKANEYQPTSNADKLNAFESFHLLLKVAMTKAKINDAYERLKPYYLLGGDLNKDTIINELRADKQKFELFLNDLNQNIKSAQVLLRKKISSSNENISQSIYNIERKHLNYFIINAARVIYYYYVLTNNSEGANYYQRIYENFKKYFM